MQVLSGLCCWRHRSSGRRSINHCLDSAGDDGAIDPVPIADLVFRGLIPGKRLGQLSRDPFSRWVCRDVNPDKISAVQSDNDKCIQQVKANARDNEQVHGSNVRRIVPQKRAPALTWRPTSLDHILGDARLRDFKPEFEQFAVDARCSPKWVLDTHPPDQGTELRLDLWPSSPRA